MLSLHPEYHLVSTLLFYLHELKRHKAKEPTNVCFQSTSLIRKSQMIILFHKLCVGLQILHVTMREKAKSSRDYST